MSLSNVGLRAVVLLAFAGGSVIACTLGSDTYIYSTEAPREGATRKGDAGPTSSGGGAEAACFEAVDLTSLTPCGNGVGHCFEEARAPYAGLLTRCAKEGEVCVPDDALRAAGGKLATCTSIIGPGACVTPQLFPKLDEQKAALSQDVCAGGQVCVPCVDPTNNNAPTPFCQSVGAFKTKSREAGCSGGSTSDAGAAPPSETCCAASGQSRGLCVDMPRIAPAGYQDTAAQGTCKSAANRCVPTTVYEKTPVRCTSAYPTAAAGKAGICLDTCFSDSFFDAEWKPLVKQGSCGASELCLPCDALLPGTPGCP